MTMGNKFATILILSILVAVSLMVGLTTLLGDAQAHEPPCTCPEPVALALVCADGSAPMALAPPEAAEAEAAETEQKALVQKALEAIKAAENYKK